VVERRPRDLREPHPVEERREVMLEQVLVEIPRVGRRLDRVLGEEGTGERAEDRVAVLARDGIGRWPVRPGLDEPLEVLELDLCSPVRPARAREARLIPYWSKNRTPKPTSPFLRVHVSTLPVLGRPRLLFFLAPARSGRACLDAELSGLAGMSGNPTLDAQPGRQPAGTLTRAAGEPA
jgi:hypothetical protein